MAIVSDPTAWYGWLIPDVGGNIGTWDTILNQMWGQDTADAPYPIGVDEVIGLIEADIDTLRSDITTLLGRITTLEANTIASMGARLEKSGSQVVTIGSSQKVEYGTVLFDEGSTTTTAHRITVPASGAGAWQIRASVTGERFAGGGGNDDSKYWEIVIQKNGDTIARKRITFLNDGGDSNRTSTYTVAIAILDGDAIEGDYYEAWIEQGDDDNDSGSSTVAAGKGTFLEAVRVFHEDARSFVQSVALTQDNTAATNHDVTLPALARVSGDIVLIAYAHRGTGAITTPTDYTALENNDDGTSSGTIFYRLVTGAEAGGDVVEIVKSGTNSMAAAAFLLRGITGNPEATSADVAAGSADPPSITPSWGAVKTVYLAISSPGEEESVTDAPTDYSSSSPAGVNGTGDEQGIDAAFRVGKQTSEDPGAFSYATSVGSGILWTVALQVA
jgi:hypothetical protein